jgi:hypothetical protein
MRHAGRTLGLLVGLIGISVTWFAPKWRMKATLVVRKIGLAHCEVLAYLTSRNEQEVILDILVDEGSTP